LTDRTDIRHGFFGITETLRKWSGSNFASFEYIPFCSSWVSGEAFSKTQQNIFVLGLLWASKDPKKSTRRLPDERESYHNFASWSWVGWTGQAVWPLDECGIAASQYMDNFTTRVNVRVSFKDSSYVDEYSGAMALEDLTPQKHVSIIQASSIQLQAHHIDRQTFDRVRLAGWSSTFLSVNPLSSRNNHDSYTYKRPPRIRRPLTVGPNYEGTLSEQEMWKAVDERELFCVLLGEFVNDRKAQAFCIVLSKTTANEYNRRGLVVLEKVFGEGEEPVSILTGSAIRWQDTYTIY
jgi:hypothetical protein